MSAPGSLTARLRTLGRVEVRVLRQGTAPLWPQERHALRQAAGHVREVLLLVEGRPAVWARSATSLQAIRGPWRAVRGLGSRPLAELLFGQRGVQRDCLRCRRLPRHAPQGQRLSRAWHMAQVADAPPHTTPPLWARHSLFRHRGHPLQVLEAFAPWVLPLECRRS